MYTRLASNLAVESIITFDQLALPAKFWDYR